VSPPIVPKDRSGFVVRAFWLAKKIVELRFTYRGRDFDFILSPPQARETRDALDAILREVEGES
jgi:hypothetical protein